MTLINYFTFGRSFCCTLEVDCGRPDEQCHLRGWICSLKARPVPIIPNTARGKYQKLIFANHNRSNNPPLSKLKSEKTFFHFSMLVRNGRGVSWPQGFRCLLLGAGCISPIEVKLFNIFRYAVILSPTNMASIICWLNRMSKYGAVDAHFRSAWPSRRASKENS